MELELLRYYEIRECIFNVSVHENLLRSFQLPCNINSMSKQEFVNKVRTKLNRTSPKLNINIFPDKKDNDFRKSSYIILISPVEDEPKKFLLKVLLEEFPGLAVNLNFECVNRETSLAIHYNSKTPVVPLASGHIHAELTFETARQVVGNLHETRGFLSIGLHFPERLWKVVTRDSPPVRAAAVQDSDVQILTSSVQVPNPQVQVTNTGRPQALSSLVRLPDSFLLHAPNSELPSTSTAALQTVNPTTGLPVFNPLVVLRNLYSLEFASINRKILEEGLASDVVIVVANGKEIKCHKSFLIAHSIVFEAMCKSDTEESGTTRIETPDLSEKVVEALLKFLYYMDISGPSADLGVALDLLHASATHKYDIPKLRTEMMNLFLRMDVIKFPVCAALKLFQFLTLIPNAERLKVKVAEVMKLKFNELERLPSYRNLFKSEVGMELCKYLTFTPK